MGTKTSFITYSNEDPRKIFKTNPKLNHQEALNIANSLFPHYELSEFQECSCPMFVCPPEDDIYIGAYPGLCIVIADELQECPTELEKSNFLTKAPYPKTILHSMHSVSDWFSYAIWENSVLKRSLCLMPDAGIIEDIGERLPFELPYWAGEHAFLDEEEQDEYPFVFHPLNLGEEALLQLFDFPMERYDDPSIFDPENLVVLHIKRNKRKAWWKFW